MNVAVNPSEYEVSELRTGLLGPESLLSVKDLNDNLPTPRCPHCNHRFNKSFESLLNSGLSCDQYITKHEVHLDYCDRMSLYSDEAIYKQYIKFRNRSPNCELDHVHTPDCKHERTHV